MVGQAVGERMNNIAYNDRSKNNEIKTVICKQIEFDSRCTCISNIITMVIEAGNCLVSQMCQFNYRCRKLPILQALNKPK